MPPQTPTPSRTALDGGIELSPGSRAPTACGTQATLALPKCLTTRFSRNSNLDIVSACPLPERTQAASPMLSQVRLLSLTYLSALRMGLLEERGLGETKEPPRVPFLTGVSWP